MKREREREVNCLPQKKAGRVDGREEGIRESVRETVDVGGGEYTLVKVVVYCINATQSRTILSVEKLYYEHILNTFYHSV